MGTDLLLPDGMEPEPERITFRPIESLLPGYVMRRGDYPRVSPPLVILAAAREADAEELDTVVLGDLTFWAEVVDREQGYLLPRSEDDPEEEEEFDPVRFLAEKIEDCEMRHFAIRVATAEDSDRGYVWLIDKKIAAGTIHWYLGGNEVSVSTNDGSVKFRRPGCDPLDVPGAKKRAAPYGCSIKAFQEADYNIAGAGPLEKTTKF